MYQVIARKYRPQTFHQVVNQEHVKQTLENAISGGRVAHGYIFAGQRGTGKTTVARILAKCLNCEKGPTVTPCLQCASCREIAASGSMDVIEIDAASNRGIDDVRELRENVRYRPSRDRYKVFIVDEAHQITDAAFNALLKTLEEPPEWVVFMLCTTEAHKIPATIASRCQNFTFQMVDFEHVVGHLQWICGQEGIEADADALSIIALAGDGSIRDSLSTLDQAIASFGKTLHAAEVRQLLGVVESEVLEEVTGALIAQSPARMLELVERLTSQGQNPQHFCRELARYFRNLLVARVVGADSRLIAATSDERSRLAALAPQFSEEDLTRCLQLILNLYRDLQHAPHPRFHLEMGLLKLVHAGRLVAIEQALAEAGTAPVPTGSSSGTGSRVAPVLGSRAGGSGSHPAPASPATGAAPPPAPVPADSSSASPSPGASDPPVIATAESPRSARRDAPSPFRAPTRESHRVPVSPSASPGSSFSGHASKAMEAAADTASPSPSSPSAAFAQQLVEALRREGHDFTADAVEHSHIECGDAEVVFHAPPDQQFSLESAVKTLAPLTERLLGRRVKIRVTLADQTNRPANVSPAGAAASAAPDAQPAAPEPSEAAARALAHPQVQQFLATFGGQIREVRDLKEMQS